MGAVKFAPTDWAGSASPLPDRPPKITVGAVVAPHVKPLVVTADHLKRLLSN
jgi:hypothetical protein